MDFKNQLTLTCSLKITAQKTISLKPWVGNMRNVMPPMALRSPFSEAFNRTRFLCFLAIKEAKINVCIVGMVGWGGRMLTDQTRVEWYTPSAYEATELRKHLEAPVAKCTWRGPVSDSGCCSQRGTRLCRRIPLVLLRHRVPRERSAATRDYENK